MSDYSVIVLGASAAGLTAALTAKRHYPEKSVLLLRKENKVPIPCGIPYTFGIVDSPDKNLIPADDILGQNGIDGKVVEATKIDRENKRVHTADGQSYGYERLIIATGSNPLVPPLPGHDLENVFSIRKDVPYLEKVIARIGQAKNLCIVGCGFIGIEIAEECRRRKPDLNISIVEMMRHCLQLVYDEEFCTDAEKSLKEKGVNLLLDSKVEAFEGDGKISKVKLAGGQSIDADVAIFGIGAVPNADIGREAGLEMGPMKGIAVDRYQRTSDPAILSCGDCSEKLSFFDGKPSGLKLASIASTEARVAGANLFSIRRTNPGVIGVYSTALADCAYAAAGLTTAQAQDKGFDVVLGQAESVNRHPGCMPGACNMKVRLLFEKGSQVLLGGQISGAKSGGELINLVSACISQRMTIDDIATFQTGTHPALTASPIAYPLVNAAEMAGKALRTPQ